MSAMQVKHSDRHEKERIKHQIQNKIFERIAIKLCKFSIEDFFVVNSTRRFNIFKNN